MKVRAIIKDNQQHIIADEILELSDEPMYGYSNEEIEQIVSNYVDNWARKHVSISFDVIDRDSGSYPYVNWEKRS